LASEWKSSKGGLSTVNRELAKNLAKDRNVSVSFFVPKCTDEDKRAASIHDVRILEAKERPGYEPLESLAFPPKELDIDFIIGHGVILGKQGQIIRESHNCKWMQVVHTAPDELAMYKTYSDAIPKGEKKQWNELRLCQKADLVVGVGPKLQEFYSAQLTSCGKDVYNFTPGIFTELPTLKVPSQVGKKFRMLVFGRGDHEDFELKGFDIAAQAVAKLNDRSYHLTFVGAPSGSETRVTNELLKQGLDRSQLIVKGYLEDRDDLTTLLFASNLAIVPSRTEGFGLTALEALSVGLPFLVSQNSGFGEAIQEIGPSFVVDSEVPEHWAEAIKGVRQKGSEAALRECRELRARYAEKYSWETQCHNLVKMMQNVVCDQPSSDLLELCAVQKIDKDISAPVATRGKTTFYDQQGARPKEKSSSDKEHASSSNRGKNSRSKTKTIW